MKKKFMTLALTAAMAASMGMTAFAGQWVQNTTGCTRIQQPRTAIQ